jgi:hypothetical protein
MYGFLSQEKIVIEAKELLLLEILERLGSKSNWKANIEIVRFLLIFYRNTYKDPYYIEGGNLTSDITWLSHVFMEN